MADVQLVFKNEEIKQLDELIGNVPTKQGLPLVNFINAVAQRRAQEAKIEEAANKQKESLPVTTGAEAAN